MIVRLSNIAEIEHAPNAQAFHDAYAAESRMPEIGEPCAQFDIYRAMEARGALHIIAAFDEAQLAGMIFLLISRLPHYGIVTSVVESFFVPVPYRKKGVGLQLLALAEEHSAELGAKAMLVSAPTNSVLSTLLSKSKNYRPSNDVYVRALT